MSRDITAVLIELFKTAVAAASPRAAVADALRRDPPPADKPLNVFALGKAAFDMLAGVGGGYRSAIIVTNAANKREPPARAELIFGGHPLPNERSLEAGRRLCEAAERSGDEFGLVLLSGGGSALAEIPAAGLPLEDIVEVNRRLLAAGADIAEMNMVRRSLSAFKGGGWASRFRGEWRCLVISDVIGDNLADIASGPMVANPTTNAEAQAVLREYEIWGELDERIRSHLNGRTDGVPAADGECRVIASNAVSVRAMAQRAAATGIPAARLPTAQGEAREFAATIAENAAREAVRSAENRMLLGGGETTVTIRGGGRGGRNQELALAFCLEAEQRGLRTPWGLLSAGTDGIDGPTDAAGGIVNDGTLATIRAKGVDPARMLADNDSYTALAAADCLLKTGATGTNVADIQALYLGGYQT